MLRKWESLDKAVREHFEDIAYEVVNKNGVNRAFSISQVLDVP